VRVFDEWLTKYPEHKADLIACVRDLVEQRIFDDLGGVDEEGVDDVVDAVVESSMMSIRRGWY